MKKTTQRKLQLASQIMTRPVETVRTTDFLSDVAALFTEKNIGAAAVIDRQGSYVGVITKTDMVRHSEQTDQNKTAVKSFEDSANGNGGPSGFHIIDEETVERWMTPVIFSMKPDTPVIQIARRMIKYGIHHIFVRDRSGELVGIVSSFDLLRLIDRPFSRGNDN